MLSIGRFAVLPYLRNCFFGFFFVGGGGINDSMNKVILFGRLIEDLMENL